MMVTVAQADAGAVIPRIPKNRVHLLWHSDYWDGPISGIAEYRKQEYWFRATNDHSRKRRYWLVRLAPTELIEELARHDDFREMVGWHCDYQENGRSRLDAHPTRDTADEFYKKYPSNPRGSWDKYLHDEVIGWFQL